MSSNFLPDFGYDSLPPDSTSDPSPRREPVRHLLYGSPQAVQHSILILHRLGYAEPNDWSRFQQTDVPGQVMSVLTQYLWLN